MVFSPNKHFLSVCNKQKLNKKIKRFSDLPTISFFGMLVETRVFFYALLLYHERQELFLGRSKFRN